MAKIFRLILLFFLVIVTSSGNVGAVSRGEVLGNGFDMKLKKKHSTDTLVVTSSGDAGAVSRGDSTCTTKLNKAYFKSYVLDTRDLFIFPKYMHKKDWVKASILIGVSSSAFLIDKNMVIESQKFRSDFTNSIAKYALEPWGSGLYSLPTLALFGVHGAVTHNVHSTNIALLGAKSFIITTATVQAIKYVLQRYRPFASPDHYPFYAQGPFGNWKNDAFPSGHTAAAFAVATAIATEYKHKPWIGILCYTVAAGTGFSRINDNKHWTSDVFFGAALGYGITKLIFTNKNHCKQKVLR